MLRQAVVNGDVEAVRSLLAQGADVDDTEGSAYGAPLHVAAKKGRVDIVALLLDAGASIDFHDDDIGATPLMLAVDAGQVDVVRYLIGRGASLTATNADGANALLYAQGAPAGARDELLRLLRKGRG